MGQVRYESYFPGQMLEYDLPPSSGSQGDRKERVHGVLFLRDSP